MELARFVATGAILRCTCLVRQVAIRRQGNCMLVHGTELSMYRTALDMIRYA